MTSATEILTDAFDRVHDGLREHLADLDQQALVWRPDADANPIGWLAWHLTRVQDDHLAGVADVEQVWTRDGFFDRFGLPYPVEAHGYGQSREEVDRFHVEGPALLLEYSDAVHAQTLEILGAMADDDYARVVDEQWDPPVTAAVRLVSVVNDTTQHLGQIGYVTGLAARRR